MKDFIVFDQVKKIYRAGEVDVEALSGVSFSIDRGQVVIITGASGAGKSTILNVLGGMDTITSGRVLVGGNLISSYNQKELAEYRRYSVGFVFQFYNLMQNLTALENVELATQICKNPLPGEQVLAQVGLAARRDYFPSQLSGGEQQRVSIARALAKNPQLLLCDEPTGALDYRTGKEVLALLQKTAHDTGATVIIVTHNSVLADMGDQVIRVKSGGIDKVEYNSHPLPVEQIEW